MAIKTERGTYACFYCGKEYTHPEKADECRTSHELVYLPISIHDVNKLIYLRERNKENPQNIYDSLRRLA